jgi:hypothetical protein
MTQPPDKFESQLRSELKQLFAGPAHGRSAEQDAQLLAAARSAGEATVRGHGRWRWRVGLGIAAAVAVAAGVLWSEMFRLKDVERPAAAPAAVATSYQHTGDIRDAYFVARQLKQHRALEAGWDANRDGVVDQKDVQALALAAVKLPPEGLPALKGEVR